MLFLAGLLVSLFTTQTPTTSAGTAAWELGTRLSTSVSGRITAIRYWRLADDPGPHVGHVWGASGVKLADVSFVGETAEGWQVQALPSPLSLMAGQTFTVSVNSPLGAHYALAPGGFTAPVVSGPLTAPVAAGVYVAGSGLFPSASTPTNYFRDVVFDADPQPVIVVGPDPVLPGAIAAQLNGFQAGSYTLGITVTNAAGAAVSASAPLVIPTP